MLDWLNFQRERARETARSHTRTQPEPPKPSPVNLLDGSRKRPRSASFESEPGSPAHGRRHLPTPFSTSPEPFQEDSKAFYESKPQSLYSRQFPSSPVTPHTTLRPELSPLSDQMTFSAGPSRHNSMSDMLVKDEMESVSSPEPPDISSLAQPNHPFSFPPTTSFPPAHKMSTFSTPAKPTVPSASLSPSLLVYPAPPANFNPFQPSSFVQHLRALNPRNRPSPPGDIAPSEALASLGENAKRLLLRSKKLQRPQS